jgi:hypothetical protein
MKPSVIIGLYVVSGCILLGCIKLLLYFTLADNSVAQHGDTQPPAELMRSLVLYGQRMLIIASLNIEWHATMAYPLRMLALAWSASSPETLSVDCMLPTASSLPLSVQRVIFYISMPVAMLLVLLVLEMLLLKTCKGKMGRRPGAAVSLVHRLSSTAMVVLFFFLPSLQHTVFGLFACIPLDRRAPPPHMVNAVGAFWVFDTNTLCLQGWHKSFALGLGVPLIALLCVVLPAVIVYITLTHINASSEPSFSRSWGFLTHSYQRRVCWWEAVVVCETAALVAISVFGVNLGPFYQCVLMVTALLLVSQMQLVFKPYLRAQTSQAMVQGAHSLLLTALAALSFLAYGPIQPSVAYGVAMGAVLLVINAVYVCSVVWKLLCLVHWLALCDAVEKRWAAFGRFMRRCVMRSQQKRARCAGAPDVSMLALGVVGAHGEPKQPAPAPSGAA